MKKSLSANTCVYPTPVWVVGTYGKDDQPNVMTAAWGGVCCSKPPCVAVSLREATLSHGNIIRSKAFTINIGTEKFATEVDYFGISTGHNVDKFAATGLTPESSTCVNAPFIAEFPLVLECRLMKIVEIGLHTQFIGEIIDVKAEESILGEKDMVDIVASFQAALADVLIKKTMWAANENNIHQIVLAGGVARNNYLRARMKASAEKEKKHILIPEPIFCTDNAAMIAWVGYQKLKLGTQSPLSIAPIAGMKL